MADPELSQEGITSFNDGYRSSFFPTAGNLAKRIDEGLERRQTGAELREGYSGFGFDLPRMTPERYAPLSESRAGGSGWVTLVDTSVVNEDVRFQRSFQSLMYPNQTYRPGHERGRLYAHLYRENVFAGTGGMPVGLPAEIMSADAAISSPSVGDVFRGQVGDAVTTWMGSDAGGFASRMIMQRGNRGVVGTLLVNAGTMLDQIAWPNPVGYRTTYYKPPGMEKQETFTEWSRTVANFGYNLGMATLIFRGTMWAGESWAKMNTMAGDAIRGASKIARTHPNPFVSSVGGSIGQLIEKSMETGFKLEAGVAQSIIDAFTETWASIGGKHARTQMEGLSAVFGNVNSLNTHNFYDIIDRRTGLFYASSSTPLPSELPHLYSPSAEAYAAVHGGKPWLITPGGTAGLYATVAVRGTNTYYSVNRMVSRIDNRFWDTVPFIGSFIRNTMIDPNPEAERASYLFKQTWKSAFKGDFSQAGVYAREHFAAARQARLVPHMYSEGGRGPTGAFMQQGIRGLMAMALVEKISGDLLSANPITLSQQIEAENRIARDRIGQNPTMFDAGVYRPQSLGEVPQALFGGAVAALSWAGQFARGLFTSGFNPFAAFSHANQMNQMVQNVGGKMPVRHYYQPGIAPGSVGGLQDLPGTVASYYLDQLTAFSRNNTTSLDARRQDVILKLASKRDLAAMSMAELERRAVAQAGGSEQALERARFQLSYLREMTSMREKSEVTLGYSMGVRVGDLRWFGFWAGMVHTGAKSTFMASLIVPMPFKGGMGVKFPFFYSAKRGFNNFKKWYGGFSSQVESDTPLDTLIRTGVNATGGHTGPVAWAAQQAMSFGYEPGTNWEAMTRVPALAMGLAGGAPAGLAFAAGGAFARMKMEGISVRDLSREVRGYYRTGVSSLSLDPFDNLGRIIQGPKSGSGAFRMVRGFAGAVLRAPGALLEAPFTAPVRFASWAYGRAFRQNVSHNFGLLNYRDGSTYVYNTSRAARGVRMFRTAVRAGIGGMILYAGANLWSARESYMGSDDQGGGIPKFYQHMQGAENFLRGVPLVGRGLASWFAAMTNINDRQYWMPEQDTQFGSTPTQSFWDEAHPIKQKFAPGAQGLAQAFIASLGQVSRQVRLDGVQTGEMTSGSSGANVAASINGDYITFSDTAVRIAPIFNMVAPTFNAFARISKNQKDLLGDQMLAQGLSGTADFAEKMRPEKGRAFMGKMFLADSPVYSASPELKIAIAQRHGMTRWALGAWSSEIKRWYGDFKTGHHDPTTAQYTTYTVSRYNSNMDILRSAAVLPNVLVNYYRNKGLRKDIEAFAQQLMRTPNFSGGNLNPIWKVFQTIEEYRSRGFNPTEVENDYAVFYEPPATPMGPTLRPPNRISREGEFTMNWFGLPASQTMVGALSLMVGALGATILLGKATRTLSRYQSGYYKSIDARIDRYDPGRKAVIRSVFQAPWENTKGEKFRSATQFGFDYVEIPMGKGYTMPLGDVRGFGFTTVTDHVTGEVFSSYDKASIFRGGYNDIHSQYQQIRYLKTAGQAQGTLEALDRAISDMNPGRGMGGVHDPLNNPTLRGINNELQRLMSEVKAPGFTPTTNLGRDHIFRIEALTRRMLYEFPEMNGLKTLNYHHVLEGTGTRGLFGRMRAAIATVAAPEDRTPAPRTSRAGSFSWVNLAKNNDPRRIYSDIRDAYKTRLSEIKRLTMTKPIEGLKSAFGGILRIAEAQAQAFTPMVGAMAVLGVASEADRTLNRDQKTAIQRQTSYMVAGDVAMMGLAALAVPAAAIPVVGPTVAAALLVGSLVAPWIVPNTVSEATMTPINKRNGIQSQLAGISDSLVSGQRMLGNMTKTIPGSHWVSKGMIDAVASLEERTANAFYYFSKLTTPKHQSDWWGDKVSGAFEIAGSLAENLIIPLGEVFPETQANREGRSFSAMSSLWAAKSPIWWGPNSAGVMGGGTGWLKDAGELEIKRQIHMRASADPIGSSLFAMMGRETMGIMGGSNEDPADSTLSALYVQKGRGTMANAQSGRAFSFTPVNAMDDIIQEELRRRAIMYEVSVLGGVGRTAGHDQGEGVYSAIPMAKPNGMGGWGSGRRPAGPQDLGGLGPQLFPGGGSGPTAPRDLSPLIGQASKKYGVPEGVIRSVISIESNFNRNAVSPVGALGLMQIMPYHWKQGEDWRDPRTNILKGTEILARYHEQLRKGMTKNVSEDELWALTAAAYNSGPNRASYKSGQVPNIAETQNYYVKFKSLYDAKPSDPKVSELRRKFEAEVVPSIMAGGNVEAVVGQKLGLPKDQAHQMAERIRLSLYDRGTWLPKDDPTWWHNRDSRLGRAASPEDRARIALEAAGVSRGSYAKGVVVKNASGYKYPSEKGYEVTLTSDYGSRQSTATMHHGIDLVFYDPNKAKSGYGVFGAPVPARNAGKVSYAGQASGYGTLVVLDLNRTYKGQKIQLFYGHGSKLLVQKGQEVRAGQRIILQGSEGHSTGAHVHFGVKVGGQWVNPANLDQYLPMRTQEDADYRSKMAQAKTLVGKFGNDQMASFYQSLGLKPEAAETAAHSYEQLMSAKGFSLTTASTAKPEDKNNKLAEWLGIGLGAAATAIAGHLAHKAADTALGAGRRAIGWFKNRNRMQPEEAYSPLDILLDKTPPQGEGTGNTMGEGRAPKLGRAQRFDSTGRSFFRGAEKGYGLVNMVVATNLMAHHVEGMVGTKSRFTMGSGLRPAAVGGGVTLAEPSVSTSASLMSNHVETIAKPPGFHIFEDRVAQIQATLAVDRSERGRNFVHQPFFTGKAAKSLPVLALRAYTSFGSYPLNTALANSAELPQVKEFTNPWLKGHKLSLAEMHQGLMQAVKPISEPTTVYRLMSQAEIDILNNGGDPFASGKTFISTADRIDSSYYKLPKAERMRKLVRIRLEAGTKVINMVDTSSRYSYGVAGFHGEREIIIAPGQASKMAWSYLWGDLDSVVGGLSKRAGVNSSFTDEFIFTLHHGLTPKSSDPYMKVITRVQENIPSMIYKRIRKEANKQYHPISSRRIAGSIAEVANRAHTVLVDNHDATLTEAIRQTGGESHLTREVNRAIPRGLATNASVLGVNALFMGLDMSTLASATATKQDRERAIWNLGVGATSFGATAASVISKSGSVVRQLSSKAGPVLAGLSMVPDTYQAIAGKTREQRTQGVFNVTTGGLSMAAGIGAAAIAAFVTAPAWAVAGAAIGAGLVVGLGAQALDNATGKVVSSSMGRVWNGARDAVVSAPAQMGDTIKNLGRPDPHYYAGRRTTYVAFFAESTKMAKANTSLSEAYDYEYTLKTWDDFRSKLEELKKHDPTITNRDLVLSMQVHGGKSGLQLSSFDNKTGTFLVSTTSIRRINNELHRAGFSPDRVQGILDVCHSTAAYYSHKNVEDENKGGRWKVSNLTPDWRQGLSKWMKEEGYDPSKLVNFERHDRYETAKKGPGFQWFGHSASNYGDLPTRQFITGVTLGVPGIDLKPLASVQASGSYSSKTLDSQEWALTFGHAKGYETKLALQNKRLAEFMAEKKKTEVLVEAGKRRAEWLKSVGVTPEPVYADPVAYQQSGFVRMRKSLAENPEVKPIAHDLVAEPNPFEKVASWISGLLGSKPKKIVQVQNPPAERRAVTDHAPQHVETEQVVEARDKSAKVKRKDYSKKGCLDPARTIGKAGMLDPSQGRW